MFAIEHASRDRSELFNLCQIQARLLHGFRTGVQAMDQILGAYRKLHG